MNKTVTNLMSIKSVLDYVKNKVYIFLIPIYLTFQILILNYLLK